MLALCFLMFAGTAKAYQAGYSNLSYTSANPVTIDGKWTTTTEWVDATPSNFGQNAAMREKFEFVTNSDGSFSVFEDIIIETWDNTNDTGDYFQVCIDGLGDGASAPAADDYRIDIYGQSTTNVTWYQGTGTAWKTIAAPAATSLQYSIALATSPTTSAPHYSCEMKIDKTSLGTNPEIGIRVAEYDAHAGGYGLQAWPPTSRDSPGAWGDIPYSMDAIPESLNLGLIIALSSVAIVAGSVIFGKRTLTKLAKKHSL